MATKPLIQKLSQSTINQIAAGEVVERPAHLLKELIENSIDAGAKSIEIDFAKGGKEVTVKDDGCGISKKELPLSLSKHATSKIQTIDDLWSLKSFGFRGEALSSASSVSHLTITTSTDGREAYMLKSDFGEEKPNSAYSLKSRDNNKGQRFVYQLPS